MTLCVLCQSIPFDSLPSLSSQWLDAQSRVNDDMDMPQFEALQPPLPQPNERIGFPHHNGLEALDRSASSCELCELIRESVHRFVEGYHRARQDPVWAYYHQRTDAFSAESQLWLTKRLDGSQGLLVFTKGVSRHVIFLVAAIGLCVEDESPLASLYPGRPVEEGAGSERCLNRVAAWVQNCMATHEHCNASLTELPSRVLDLQCSSDPDHILLVDSRGARGYYATLSYCWGTAGHFTTSLATMEARKKNINLGELPKTFQDAITVTRKVGIRYLWVDSLCICQDDAEDWARESARMAALYSHSRLTIAATGAKDNDVGCFSRRPRRRYVPIDFTADNEDRHEVLAFQLSPGKASQSRNYLDLAKEPLTARAWALQERAMSPRLLHYCSDQTYFECNTEFRSEDGFQERGRYNSLHPGPQPSYFPISRDSLHSKEHSLWYHLLEDYTSRQLTRPSDKLPALSGIAHIFEQRTKSKYVAGLWSNALIEGMAWQGLGGYDKPMQTQSARYLAPSWSWASYDGLAATGLDSSWKYVAKVVDYHVELKTSNPYGEVKDGWIKLQAPLIPVSLSEMPEKDENALPRRRNMRLKTTNGNPFGGYAGFDRIRQHTEQTREYVKRATLFLLILAKQEAPSDNSDDHDVLYQALVVAAEASGSERMQRWGWMILGTHTLGDVEVVENTGNFTTVTLF